MTPQHDQPGTGDGKFDLETELSEHNLNMLIEVLAAKTKLYTETLRDQRELAEVLLAALVRDGSPYCAGCGAAQKVADTLKETATAGLAASGADKSP